MRLKGNRDIGAFWPVGRHDFLGLVLAQSQLIGRAKSGAEVAAPLADDLRNHLISNSFRVLFNLRQGTEHDDVTRRAFGDLTQHIHLAQFEHDGGEDVQGDQGRHRQDDRADLALGHFSYQAVLARAVECVHREQGSFAGEVDQDHQQGRTTLDDAVRPVQEDQQPPDHAAGRSQQREVAQHLVFGRQCGLDEVQRTGSSVYQQTAADDEEGDQRHELEQCFHGCPPQYFPLTQPVSPVWV